MPFSNTAIVAIIFVTLVTWRVYYCLTLPILDCDETFNYWEPAFALLQQQKATLAEEIEPLSPSSAPSPYFGKQTWEYAPEFALRSWLFVWLYAFPGYLTQHLQSLLSGQSLPANTFANDTVVLYFICKISLTVLAAVIETYFITAVGVRLRALGTGRAIALEGTSNTKIKGVTDLRVKQASIAHAGTLLAFLIVGASAGTTQAAVSFLPSSFATLCSYVALGSWLLYDSRGRCGSELVAALHPKKASPTDRPTTSIELARQQNELTKKAAAIFNASASIPLLAGIIVPVAASAIVGWPFAILVALPLALDVLYHDGILRPLLISIQSVLVLGVAVLAFDILYYQKLVWSPWQLVAYNVFGGKDRGPELYGVEPWNFFFKNLFLNFNFSFVAAMAAPLVFLCSPTYALPGRTSVNRDETDDAQTKKGVADVLDEAVARRLKQLKEERAKEKKGFGYFDEKGNKSADTQSPMSSGLVVPPLSLTRGRLLLYVSPFFLWFGFWLRIPHKEERFMAPAYPFLVLAAVLCFHIISRVGSQCFYIDTATTDREVAIVDRLYCFINPLLRKLSIRKEKNADKKPIHLLSLVVASLVLTSALINQLRLLGIAANYGGLQAAALATRREISESRSSLVSVADSQQSKYSQTPKVKTLCVGVDWYRYPGSFFLPPSFTWNSSNAHHWKYCFLKTKAFSGALPMDFKTKSHPIKKLPPGQQQDSTKSGKSGVEGGSYITVSHLHAAAPRPDMNDLNKEVLPHQYCSSIDVCDAVMDTADVHEEELNYEDSTYKKSGDGVSNDERWSIVDGTVTSENTKGIFERIEGGKLQKAPTPLSPLLALLENLPPITSSSQQHLGAAKSYAILDSSSPFLTCRALWLLGYKRQSCKWRPVVVLVRSNFTGNQGKLGNGHSATQKSVLSSGPNAALKKAFSERSSDGDDEL